MAKNTVRMSVSGLSELDAALSNISKSAGRAALRRSLQKAAQPIAEVAKGFVPEDTGKLRKSIKVGTMLDGRQKKLHRKLTKDERSSIELFVGPSYLKGDGGRHGHLVEFGTAPHINKGQFAGTKNPGTPPRPFMRPAFDREAKPTVERLKPLLYKEIERAAKRQAKRDGWEV